MSPSDASSLPATTQERCPECGASVTGGRAGCQAAWDEISAQAYSDPAYAATRDLAFDAYCMQHVERFCRSAKSYAAHLTRLCCGLEHRGDPKVYEAIQGWLNGTVAVEKPEALSFRGQITVVDVRAARNVKEHTRLVHDWATSVWEAYATQHDIAHHWIQAAQRAPDGEKSKHTA